MKLKAEEGKHSVINNCHGIHELFESDFGDQTRKQFIVLLLQQI